MVTDAQGRQGGASDILLVGATDDATCLNNNAMSTTLRAPISTSRPISSPTSSSSPASEPSTSQIESTGVPISAIAGTVIGSLLFLAVIVTLGLFFLKNVKKKVEEKKSAEFGHQRRMPSNGDFFHNGNSGSYPPPLGSAGYYPHSPNSAAALDNPFADSNTHLQQYSPPYPPDPFQSGRPAYPPTPMVPPPHDPFNAEGTSSAVGVANSVHSRRPSQAQTTTSQSKAAMAGVSNYAPPRFVVHTDIEDELPPPNDDGVVELPPQYVERPGPSRQFSVRNPSPSHTNYGAGSPPSAYSQPHIPSNTSPYP